MNCPDTLIKPIVFPGIISFGSSWTGVKCVWEPRCSDWLTWLPLIGDQSITSQPELEQNILEGIQLGQESGCP